VVADAAAQIEADQWPMAYYWAKYWTNYAPPIDLHLDLMLILTALLSPMVVIELALI
jgi:hypothetical protein